MIRKFHSASFLTIAIVGGLALPAMASTPILSFADVDEAPRATISGNTATVANVTNLVAASTAEVDFDDVREGWFACDTEINFGFTGPTITSLILSGPTINGISFTPPSQSGVWKCLSLDEVSSSVDLSTVDIWDEVGSSNVPYSTKAAQFPHIAYLGAYVMKTQSPTTTNMRLVTPQTIEYTPSAAPAVVMPVFTVASNGTITIQTAPSWTGQNAGSEEFVIKAFLQSQSAVTTPVTGQALNTLGSSGNPLFDSSSTPMNLITPTTLVGAKVYDNGTFTDYDPAIHGREIVIQAYADYGQSQDPYGVSTASQTFSGSLSGAQPQVVAAPYTGPILQTPGAVAPVAQGSKVVIPGSNLSGVSKVEIGGVDAKVVVNSSGELEITVPTGLAAGTYDLVVTSDSGKLTVQDGIRISGPSVGSSTGSATPSTKRIQDNTAKVWVFDVVGAGKVQILVNGTEIAWVRASEASDSKLTNGYLVRTVNLQPGKNVIEVVVDGERVRRTVYSN